MQKGVGGRVEGAGDGDQGGDIIDVVVRHKESLKSAVQSRIYFLCIKCGIE